MLTDKQELFAIEFVLNGGDATQAYYSSHDVGSDTKRTTVYANASRVRNNSKVAARIHQLQMERFSPMIISIDDRKKVLTKMILDEDLQAMDILNKMTGAYSSDDNNKFIQDEIIDG